MEITMETDCFIVKAMAQGDRKFQNQEDTPTVVKGGRLDLDPLKEDGIRKELYENERKAREYWNKKWGFLQNSEKLQQEEIAKHDLSRQIFDLNMKKEITSGSEAKKCAFELLPSKKVPAKTSEMIGWRLFTEKNELNKLVGPMYVSPKLTMNPPASPDEPDLTQQKIIYLG